MMMAQFLCSHSISEAPTGNHGAAAQILGIFSEVISEIGLRQDWAQLAEKLLNFGKMPVLLPASKSNVALACIDLERGKI
ncbi:hypothetical protein WN944_011244 [Citrus x changshan-huyou]|uniref:Uncharacterized protein n=1 Tax=Citrus x changshan-huyou TaxID=2935761 RepID=A0AAP0QTJ3_9ROSI